MVTEESFVNLENALGEEMKVHLIDLHERKRTYSGSLFNVFPYISVELKVKIGIINIPFLSRFEGIERIEGVAGQELYRCDGLVIPTYAMEDETGLAREELVDQLRERLFGEGHTQENDVNNDPNLRRPLF